MMVGGACAAGTQKTQGNWGQISYSTEALVILGVTAVIFQLRFTPLFPRIVLLCSKGCALLGLSDYKDTEIVPGTEKKSEAEQSKALAPEIPSLEWEGARRDTRIKYRAKINEILGICASCEVFSHLTLKKDEDVRGLKIHEAYELNSRGFEIFTKRWIPEIGLPKASICFCHGYGDTCTFFFEVVARALAAKGFAVFAMDYVGFGLSGGLHAYIPSFDRLVEDVNEHYCSIKESEEFKHLPFFLMGESVGGAVALKAHMKKPKAWDGAVLVAPMCKIAKEMYPPWYTINFLKLLARIIPKAKIVPSGDIAEIGFRDLEKRAQAMQNLIAYTGKPRLGTALSLLNATEDIEKQLHKVSLPLLILHGAADRVTDPAVSKALFEQASTSDKKLHLYEDAWHAVLEGEPDETVNKAIDDIVRWLDARSVGTES